MNPSGPRAMIQPPLHLSTAQLAEGLSECFQGYLVDLRFTPELVASMIRAESIDLTASLVASSDDQTVAILLVARRGRVSRLAAMAIAPAFRGKGHGKRLLERVVEDARLRGDTHVVLEVLEKNEPAMHLYSAAGFRTRQRLIGFGGLLTIDEYKHAQVEECPLTDVAEAVRKMRPNAASWQASAANVEQFSLPTIGVRVGKVFAAVIPVGDSALVCRSLAIPDDREALGGFCQALAATFPGRTLRVPPYFGESTFRSAAEAAGLTVDPVTQFQMELRLVPAPIS